jgi:hypothetical protein
VGFAAIRNPDPSQYRVSEICWGSGAEDGYPGLVPLRGRGGPYFPREVVDRIIRDYEIANSDQPDELSLRWAGDALELRADDERAWISPNAEGLYDFGEIESIGSHVWTWEEFRPPWPDELSGEAIAELFNDPRRSYWLIVNRIAARATLAELRSALRVAASAPDARAAIAYVLAHRAPKVGEAREDALELLEILLEDGDPEVRLVAADAVDHFLEGPLHDRALEALQAQLSLESDPYVAASIESSLSGSASERD